MFNMHYNICWLAHEDDGVVFSITYKTYLIDITESPIPPSNECWGIRVPWQNGNRLPFGCAIVPKNQRNTLRLSAYLDDI